MRTAAVFAVLACACAARATEGVPRAMQLWPETDATLPASLAAAVGGEVFEALADQQAAFSRDVESMDAGGGDGGGAIAALAFVLGVIPGFGIGHLISGAIWGFVTWLVVDVVVAFLLFYVFPVLLFAAFPLIFTLDIIVQVLERFLEGYASYATARRRESFVALGAPAAAPGADAFASPVGRLSLLSFAF